MVEFNATNVIREITTITKNVVVTTPTVTKSKSTSENSQTIYLYYSGGNEWADKLRTEDITNYISKDDFNTLYTFNHNTNIPIDRKDYYNMRLVRGFWRNMFDQQSYLSVDNKQFVSVSCGNLEIKVHTIEDAKKYLVNRPNPSEIITKI